MEKLARVWSLTNRASFSNKLINGFKKISNSPQNIHHLAKMLVVERANCPNCTLSTEFVLLL